MSSTEKCGEPDRQNIQFLLIQAPKSVLRKQNQARHSILFSERNTETQGNASH